jgi:hypothetical protein
MGGGSEAILQITGKLENLKDTPLTYVKFQFELLGEQDIVVFRDYGYNRKAEPLRDEDYESGKVLLEDKRIELIGSKEESFRFIFFKKEIPEFRSFRIRVLETHEHTNKKGQENLPLSRLTSPDQTSRFVSDLLTQSS